MTLFHGHASGRVNLIGEHTDYNGGFVLPTAIPQQTRVSLRKRSDRIVLAKSQNLTGSDSKGEFELGKENRLGRWIDYVQGVSFIARQNGLPIEGFEVEVDSDVPLGSGLSSSAALEVSLFRALRETFQWDLNDVQIAQLCQKVENDFVGAKVGIMDPMACSLASPGEALFLDTRSLNYRSIRLPKQADLIVINSGISHRNVGGDYNTRRSECEEACRSLGVSELRDIEAQDLPQLEKRLTGNLLKRARHVVTENDRVVRTVRALENDDLQEVGKLFLESHRSMRDDYEVSIPEIDALVELMVSHKEVFGARLTGGGFGGSIVAMAELGRGREIALGVIQEYENRFKVRASLLVPSL